MYTHKHISVVLVLAEGKLNEIQAGEVGGWESMLWRLGGVGVEAYVRIAFAGSFPGPISWHENVF